MASSSMLKTLEKILTEEVVGYIVSETKRYAISSKTNPNFEVSVEDINIFLGFLIFSGYWSESEDLGALLVKMQLAEIRTWK